MIIDEATNKLSQKKQNMNLKKYVHRTAKFAVSIGLACTMMVSASVSASAAGISRSASTFSTAWERYAVTSDGQGSLTYGFNTWLVNEDYAWARHNTRSHYAVLKNGSGWHTGSGKKAGATSRVDVTHKGTYVTYSLNY